MELRDALVQIGEIHRRVPGLSAIAFGRGVVGSAVLLSRATYSLGQCCVRTGLLRSLLARGERAPAAWSMGLTLGLGHALTAAVQRWTLGGTHEAGWSE